MVGVENPMVIDHLWYGYNDVEEDVEKCRVKIDIDTSALTDAEVTDLINELESLSYDVESAFKVDYDLDVNRDADGDEGQTVLIELRGWASEFICEKIHDTCCKYYVDVYDYEIEKQLAQNRRIMDLIKQGKNGLIKV